MLRPLKSFPVGSLITLAFLSWNLIAQEPSSPSPKVPVTTVTDTKNITFTWPVMRGRWGLFEMSVPYTNDWQLVSSDLYHTNATNVSATVPLPATTTLFVVKRNFALPPTFRMPPLPAKPTNHPPPTPPHP
jgi:hypothetical protein